MNDQALPEALQPDQARTSVNEAHDLLDRLEKLRTEFGVSPAGREVSIACSAMEDVIMRLNRAWARHGGFFSVADCEQQFIDMQADVDDAAVPGT